MSILLRNLLKRYHAPRGGEGEDLPGADYGDDFTPTGDDAPAAKASADADADADAPAGAADEGEGGEGGGEDEGLRGAVEETPDNAEDDKKSTGTPKTGKGKFIPLDRHEKLLKKERARREELEAQLSQSRAGQEVVKTNDALERIETELVNMEAQYNELLAEGDIKGAAQLMTQIRRKNTELSNVTAAQRDAEVMARAVEKVRYDEALDRIEEAYPELNPDADEYDDDKYQDVLDLMRAGQQRGLSPTKSLQRAVNRVMGADTAEQKRATTVTPRVDESEIAAKRRSEAVKRNLDAAGRTPPATHRTGAGNDTAGGALTAKAVMDMDEDEFAKLSEKDLARLRGDVL